MNKLTPSYNYCDEMSNLLKRTPSIKKNDIYDFEGTPFEDTYEVFYQFCQENLRNYCQEYEIQPSYFYFKEDIRVNASADLKEDTYIISVNKGTIYELYQLFHNNEVFKNNASLKEYNDLQNCIDVSIDTLMFHLSTLFTYYHELGHLIQKSPLLLNGHTENYGNDFNFLKHLKEFDADLHGINSIGFHVIQYWNKLKPECQSKENLERILATSIASIFCYMTLLFQSFSNDIYYYSNTHPHPLIRITYILPTFIDVLNIHLQVNQKNILDKGFAIATEIFKAKSREDLVSTYKDNLFHELPNVKTYIKTLIDEADKIPYLAVNKVHKKNMRKS